MGTYNYSTKELVSELVSFLDDIEGDFTKQQLKNALEFCSEYGFTINSTKKEQKIWKSQLKRYDHFQSSEDEKWNIIKF